MIVSDLPVKELTARLRRAGLVIRAGPFAFNIRSDLPELADGLAQLYANHPLGDADGFADFHVSVDRPHGLRRWYRQQIFFKFDGTAPFLPLPREQAMPALEWGLNWAVANHAHQYLIVHAAALSRNGRAVIMPGPPGAGKSTLCAALAHRGWRLLSDELTLVDMRTGMLRPLARPISLKNQSIDIMCRFAPDAVLSEPAHDTVKGSVALLRPPEGSVVTMSEPAVPAWIVVPEYAAGAATKLTDRSRARMLIELGRNAFNYSILGRAGFLALAALVERCQTLAFRYSALDEAVATFDRMADAGLNTGPDGLNGS